MSLKSFNIETLAFPGVFPRGHPRCTQKPTDRLEVVVNKYTPRSNPNPKTGDVSIILLHANGFHKELYEPFFDAIVERSERAGFRIRAIWAPDVWNQGASGVRNEEKLGDTVDWLDNSRDLIKMFSLFDIPQPVIGIGHSMGGAQLFYAAICQPNLFTAIIGIDPVIEHTSVFVHASLPAAASSRRKDIWPNLEEATKYFTSRGFYKRWDHRALDLHLKYGLRELPTKTYPHEKGVTLTTPRHQEVYTFLKARPHPDGPGLQFYRDEPKRVFDQLGEIKCPVLYVFGGRSEVSSPENIKRKKTRTGKGDAEIIVIKEAGHLVPQEEVDKSADAVVPFIAKQAIRWKKEYEQDLKQPREPLLPAAWVKQLSEGEANLRKLQAEILDIDILKAKSRM